MQTQNNMKNKNILLKLLVFCVISFSSNKSFTQNTEKDSLLKANNFLKVFIPDKSFVSEKMQCYKVAPELNVTISDVLKYKKEFLGLSDDDELILQELTDERQFGSGGNGKAYSQFYKGYFVNNAYIAITTNKQKQVTFIVNQLVKNINIDTKTLLPLSRPLRNL
ncbi:MAG: hypothetical protein IPJ79_10350 [Bacteroidetes bacterium]|nr:hypothetical protein [Bacteroidota bacterium]